MRMRSRGIGGSETASSEESVMIQTPPIKRAFVVAVSVVLALALPLVAAASDRWFHVHVDDRSSGGAEVSSTCQCR